jgi:hypothetical protein
MGGDVQSLAADAPVIDDGRGAISIYTAILDKALPMAQGQGPFVLTRVDYASRVDRGVEIGVAPAGRERWIMDGDIRVGNVNADLAERYVGVAVDKVHT